MDQPQPLRIKRGPSPPKLEREPQDQETLFLDDDTDSGPAGPAENADFVEVNEQAYILVQITSRSATDIPAVYTGFTLYSSKSSLHSPDMPNCIYDQLDTPGHDDPGVKIVLKAGIQTKDGDQIKVLSHSWRRGVLWRAMPFWVGEYVKETMSQFHDGNFGIEWTGKHGMGILKSPYHRVYWDVLAVDVDAEDVQLS